VSGTFSRRVAGSIAYVSAERLPTDATTLYDRPALLANCVQQSASNASLPRCSKPQPVCIFLREHAGASWNSTCCAVLRSLVNDAKCSKTDSGTR